MRRMLSALVVVLLYASATTSSQSAIYQGFEYPVTPADGYVELAPEMFMAAGYAFDCNTGLPPQALMITAERLSLGWPRTYVPQSIQVYRYLYRPDVQRYYAGTCPNVSAYTGYAARVWPALPAGYWRVYVTWASAPFGQQTVSKIVQVMAR